MFFLGWFIAVSANVETSIRKGARNSSSLNINSFILGWINILDLMKIKDTKYLSNITGKKVAWELPAG